MTVTNVPHSGPVAVDSNVSAASSVKVLPMPPQVADWKKVSAMIKGRMVEIEHREKTLRAARLSSRIALQSQEVALSRLESERQVLSAATEFYEKAVAEVEADSRELRELEQIMAGDRR